MAELLKSVKPHIQVHKREGILMGNLTQKDKEVLEYIKKYMLENGTTPTIREIGIAVHLYSTSTVHKHFQRLVDKGYIEQLSDGKSYKYRVKGMRYVAESEL